MKIIYYRQRGWKKSAFPGGDANISGTALSSLQYFRINDTLRKHFSPYRQSLSSKTMMENTKVKIQVRHYPALAISTKGLAFLKKY